MTLRLCGRFLVLWLAATQIVSSAEAQQLLRESVPPSEPVQANAQRALTQDEFDSRTAWTEIQQRRARREELVAERQPRAARSPSEEASRARVTNVLFRRSERFFADRSGNLVVVGEVENVSGSALSFARVTYDFFGASGNYVDRDYSYVFGAENARLVASGLFTNVLPPGAIGFFKVWTSIPYSSVSEYVFSSEAETYATSAPRARLVPTTSISLGANWLGGTDYRFLVGNSGSGATAYFVKAFLAGYLGSAINDVDFSYADGSSVTQCGITTRTAIVSNATALIDSFFLRPVTQVQRLAFEWDEVAVSRNAFDAAAGGGVAGFTVFSECPWTANSNADWMSITNGAAGSGDGSVVFAVSPNITGATRVGTLTAAGLTVTVTQYADVVAPTISGNPSGSTVASGQNVTLHVTAGGTAPLLFQWYYGSSGDTSNPISGATSASYTTPPLTSEASYWVRVSNAAGFADSNAAVIRVLVAFTDGELVPLVTLVRAVHITELRVRISNLRARFGLPAFSWTDPTLAARLTPLRTIHVIELRSALRDVYDAAGRTSPTYSDPSLVPGATPAKVVHVRELRDAVIAVE